MAPYGSDTWHETCVHLCEWLTLSHVSKEGNKRKYGEKRKRKSNGRIKKKNENLKGMGVEQTGEFGGIRTREKKEERRPIKINQKKKKGKEKEIRKVKKKRKKENETETDREGH